MVSDYATTSIAIVGFIDSRQSKYEFLFRGDRDTY
jgi:hypothetical protein